MKQASQSQNETQIEFNEQGIPFSLQFDDIYFDASNGYQQSQEIFIEGNQLKTQWQAWLQQAHISEHSRFTIAETGFGTGLNFFLTLRYLEQCVRDNFSLEHSPSCIQSKLKLRFVSVEKFPMTASQIAKSLACFDALTPYVDDFVRQYEQAQVRMPNSQIEKFSGQFLNGQVELIIYFDDATKAFNRLEANTIDAWFLDGFAPKKNPDMWHQGLYQAMAKLSKEKATLATFTVAGMVRRGLYDAGFWVEKSKNCGVKDEILVGFYQGDGYQKPTQAFKQKARIEKAQHVTIVGGGIASACAAYHLVQAGVKVTLLCQDNALAKQASGNAIGAVYPLLHQTRDKLSSFYANAFEYAHEFYHQLLADGYQFSHSFNGVLELSYKEALVKRQQKFDELASWPSSLVHGVSREQATEHAGMDLGFGGLLMPKAGWVSPPETVKAIFKAVLDSGLCELKFGIKINQVELLNSGRWQLIGEQTLPKQDIPAHSDETRTKKFKHKCKTLVLAGGAFGAELDVMSSLPLDPVRGQVSQIKSNQQSEQLNLVVCHKGYMTPALNGVHCIGATFDKGDTSTVPRAKDDESNLASLMQTMPEFVASTQWKGTDIVASKANLRCCTPDHMPVVGALPDNDKHRELYWKLSKDKNLKYAEPAPNLAGLYTLTGLGARGLCSAPLLGKMLAAELCHQPMPVDCEMAFDLAPNRFVIKGIIKNQLETNSKKDA